MAVTKSVFGTPVSSIWSESNMGLVYCLFQQVRVKLKTNGCHFLRVEFQSNVSYTFSLTYFF